MVSDVHLTVGDMHRKRTIFAFPPESEKEESEKEK